MCLFSQPVVRGQIIRLNNIGPDSNNGFEYQAEVNVVYKAEGLTVF